MDTLAEFGARVNELIPRLRRYARALTGERSAADDLVQDTLERAWTKLHLWRAGSDLRAWLFTIMHNVHVNQVRSRSAAATLPLDDDVADAPVRATQADMLEVRDIDTALKRLPVEQREVLLLVALEHMSYQETADTLGIPIGTVMSRLARARERLRMMLDADAGATSLKVVK
ncbi:MAG TPA: RNA polymerase sigma factor [Burkholderiales bacterium]|nr:RNA polymerase sigma factor [Burkholderiales bacterium]